jgi:hypothetical protein
VVRQSAPLRSGLPSRIGLALVRIAAFAAGYFLGTLVFWLALMLDPPMRDVDRHLLGVVMGLYMLAVGAALNALAFVALLALPGVHRATRRATAAWRAAAGGALAAGLSLAGITWPLASVASRAIGQPIGLWLGFLAPGGVAALLVALWNHLSPRGALPRSVPVAGVRPPKS